MSEVLIISMSKEQLNALFTEKIEEAKQSIANMEDEYKKVYDHKVDRNYLRRNFKWGKTRIERFEAEGKLKPLFTPEDTKTHYYKLRDCIKLHLSLS